MERQGKAWNGMGLVTGVRVRVMVFWSGCL